MVIRIISNYFLQKINTNNFTPIKFECPFKYINITYPPINIGSTMQADNIYRMKYYIQ